MQDTPKRTTIVEIVVAMLFLIIATVSIFLFSPTKESVHVYDCSLAEFHPDFPVEVREKCRRIRANNI